MQSSYKVVGGNPISGKITPSGNKNAVLPLIAASLLTEDKVILTNIPNISDVGVQFEILRKLGASVKYNRKEHNASIHAKNISDHVLDRNDVSKTRGSILFLGALIGRMKKAVIWSPGGDKIGKRPMDSYFLSLEKLGAKVEYGDESYNVEAKKLVGTTIWQGEKAVTGTENLIMASVLAKGTTTIINAASEPHVQDLCNFLVKMGAIIQGIGTDTLNITGVTELHGCEFEVGFDFMEAATFIVAAGITGGELTVNNIEARHMGMILNEFGKLGLCTKSDESSVFVPGDQKLKIMDYFDGSMNKLECLPWPGFPPDVLQFATVLATQSKGKILIHDKMYEGRLFYTMDLVSMGADIFLCDPHRIIVNGKTPLKARVLKSPDIRAGMSLLLAALVASGESVIERGEIIERGYEEIEGKFRSLGANIKRVIQ
jgi:UDP-N-acetylglucosamine 1-carboxyvinyltransferase